MKFAENLESIETLLLLNVDFKKDDLIFEKIKKYITLNKGSHLMFSQENSGQYLNFLTRRLNNLYRVQLDETHLNEQTEEICSLISEFTAIGGGKYPKTLTWPFRSETDIYIQEDNYSESGLGWQTWIASYAMASLMDEEIFDVRDKKVITLGCGTGLCGIAAARFGAKRVTLTDNSEKCLLRAKKNIKLNNVTCATTKFLDWDLYASKKFFDSFEDHEVDFDVILAADCCYEMKMAFTIPFVILNIFKKTTSKNPIAYITIQVRGELFTEVETLEKNLKNLSLQVEKKVIGYTPGRLFGNATFTFLKIWCGS
ncbi:hypothetical protein HDU92_008057 [Lobulomyces angularis]|nr:hypothetical protein HDU92_008057 [Lobulomyces angularis]